MIKKIIAFLFAIFLCNIIIYAQTNLELANNYYNSDDYQNSVEYFKKTIFEDKKYNGTIFYRFAYSCEKSEIKPSSSYSVYYSASAYCFEIDKDTDNKYYSYAIAKEQEFDISHSDFSEKTIESLLKGKKFGYNKNFIDKFIDFFTDKINSALDQENYIFLWILGICIVIIYIIGRFFSKNTECVIFSSKLETTILCLPYFLVIILSVFGNGAKTFLEIQETRYFLFASVILTLILSIVFSIFENRYTKSPILYTIISIITKLSLCIIGPIVIVFVFLGLGTPKEDKRYRDGTKGNKKTRNAMILVTVAAFLVYSLIKTPKKYKNDEILEGYQS